MEGLLLVDHGSRRAASNAQLTTIAAQLAALRPDDRVALAHLEIALPSIATAWDELLDAAVSTITVLPYFLGDGRHLREDIPALIVACHARRPCPHRIGRALGPDPALAHLLLARAQDLPFVHPRTIERQR